MKFILINILFITLVYTDTFENVQILDFESKRDLNKYMKSIGKDLGVKCSHCHNMDDKAADTPNKDIAREMIKLTRYLNDLLNTQFQDTSFNKTYVTCWTCHFGTLDPVAKRPVEE